MALGLFRDQFDADDHRANWAFYRDKSMNFSSMSFAINSIMAADMGEMADAYRDFLISAGQDLDEDLTGRKDTSAGLHGTAAGGAWMAAVFGFAGVHLSEKGLRINPNLPPQWTAIRFGLSLRGQWVSIEIDHEAVALTPADRPAGLTVSVAGEPVDLKAGTTARVRYRR